MGLHHSLSARSAGYARWHTLPYVTILHFLALTIFLSGITLYLEDKLVTRVIEMTVGNSQTYDIEGL